MTRDLIIGLEVGSAEAAAVAFDRDGREIATGLVPESSDTGLLAGAMQELGRVVPDLSRRALAVAMTGAGPATPANRSGTPWSDGPRAGSPTATEVVWTTQPLSPHAMQDAALDPGIPSFRDVAAPLAAAIAAGFYDGTNPRCSILGPEEAHLRHGSPPAAARPGAEDAKAQLWLQPPGAGLGWLLDLAGDLLRDFGAAPPRGALLSNFDADILAAAPGELLFESDASSRGVQVDTPTARSHLFGLSTRHGFSHLLRAAIERFAFAARDAHGSGGASEIRLAGAVAGSQALRVITASVGRVPVRALTRERPAAAGAALMAALATGRESDLPTAGSRWVTPYLSPVTQPDGRLADLYDRLRPIRLKAREASTAVRSGVQALPEPGPRPSVTDEGAPA